MTDLQIRYFLAAARHLNFTEAAKQLYISQPALSQQISALEHELNMQLFIRQKGHVYLTPAAVVLLEELPKYEQHYTEIIDKARIAHQGIAQTLRLGMLEGQCAPTTWLPKFFDFRTKHPEIEVQLSTHSLGQGLIRLLEDRIDVALLPDFEVEGQSSLLTIDIEPSYAVACISKYHPLANEHITSLKQLQNETLLMLRESESATLYHFLLHDCRQAGFTPNIRFVDSLEENNLNIELGLGVGITNHYGYACYNPNIIPLKDLKISTKKFVFAWKKANHNTAISSFVNECCMKNDAE